VILESWNLVILAVGSNLWLDRVLPDRVLPDQVLADRVLADQILKVDLKDGFAKWI
jgi:hypothetical protein